MKYLFTFLLSCLAGYLLAQVQHGTITYLRTTEVSLTMDNDDPGADKVMQEMMAQMSASGAFNKTFNAHFSPTEFSCEEEYKKPTEIKSELSGGRVVVMMTGDSDPAHYHTNTQTGEVTNKDFILDKSFLVSGKKPVVEWKLTGEKIAPSEQTAGLDLLVATGISAEGDTLIAGYAPSLPVQVGPLNYYGLPGAIITLRIPRNGQETVYRATTLSVSPEPLEIKKPTEGKPISYDKFLKEREKRQPKVTRVDRSN
ncbi:GLPGLI family protein [Neolewinella lacunae]|uniref:GLPGLI family protein n=1 Tax=Neolewinella lacunae TaxID=1517758 RepID=A0A923TAH2_9BACT|nr:GLPGLI family protein [Neolewinella lacunae]MBC6996489.1 GLPGLI family protein [Neolewinella lacunae]MDN3636642.1 GLPGLI family protein [Neolewinella lacunae]